MKHHRGGEMPSQAALLAKLRGGDRRSIGRVPEVVAAVRKDPRLFPVLFEGIFDDDEVVRMRAADAAEKLTIERPELLGPFRQRLLEDAARSEQAEVRWHVAQMLPRLRLSARARARAVTLLFSYLHDESNIVKASSLQALADLAVDDEELRARLRPTMERMCTDESPAVRARARRLVTGLRRAGQRRHPKRR